MVRVLAWLVLLMLPVSLVAAGQLGASPSMGGGWALYLSILAAVYMVLTGLALIPVYLIAAVATAVGRS